jgi:hypothetical protein
MQMYKREIIHRVPLVGLLAALAFTNSQKPLVGLLAALAFTNSQKSDQRGLAAKKPKSKAACSVVQNRKHL